MRLSERIRLVQYGLGAIGLMAAKAILERPDLDLVGAIDNDPVKQQRDVADLSGLKRPSGIRVSDRPVEVLESMRPQVVLHTTQSRLDDVASQLKECISVGAGIVSTCEELLCPSVGEPELSTELDLMARSKQAVVLGTGVNPGFVMDTMALAASAACLDIRSIRVERVVDASTRREVLQGRVGAGLTPSQFRRRIAKGEIGHRGLRESLHLVAMGLGWELDRVTERVSAVLADRKKQTDYVEVKKGEVCGFHHLCRGYRNRREVLRLDLKMFLGAKKPADRISIKGKPDLSLLFEDGVAGEEATVGMLLSMIPSVLAAPPGLRTMLDVPLPRFRAWS